MYHFVALACPHWQGTAELRETCANQTARVDEFFWSPLQQVLAVLSVPVLWGCAREPVLRRRAREPVFCLILPSSRFEAEFA